MTQFTFYMHKEKKILADGISLSVPLLDYFFVCSLEYFCFDRPRGLI